MLTMSMLPPRKQFGSTMLKLSDVAGGILCVFGETRVGVCGISDATAGILQPRGYDWMGKCGEYVRNLSSVESAPVKAVNTFKVALKGGQTNTGGGYVFGG